MDLNTILELIKSGGPDGLVVALLVLIFVYLGEFTNLFKNGLLKRWATVISGVLFSGVRLGDKQASIEAAIGIAVAGIAHLLVDAAIAELRKRKETPS